MANLPLSYQAANISATTAVFQLEGGEYGVTYNAASWGTVTLEVLSNDATTWLIALTAFAANGCTNGVLIEGTYRLLVSGATGVYVNVSRIVRQ